MSEPYDPFCSPFDHALATSGPPAVFLRDPEGRMRFDADWTRDAWGRLADGQPTGAPVHRWLLARDHDSGYVQLVLVTSPELLSTHPRLALRPVPSREAAVAAIQALGRPPIAREPW
ncbi:MAG: hypothetical protein ABMA64_03830 [Myxococcota bacterium]